MSVVEIVLIAIALAMDCFAVSIVSGAICRKLYTAKALRMAFLFSLFQALMPLIGWTAIHYFQHSVEAYDHWIAFGFLFIIGAKMIRDSFSGEEASQLDPLLLSTQLLLAVATSIDALAVGISMSCSGFSTARMLVVPLIIIGVVSFLFSLAGSLIGVRYGDTVAKKIRPELLGGIILIGIGIKILLEHLLG